MQKLPTLSVVVITKGRRNLLLNAISSILEADYPANLREIIVLEETNSPEPIPNVRYETIPLLNKGFAYARNYALNFVSNEIVVFIDDDCIAEKNWLMELVKPFATQQDAAAVAGAVLIPKCGILGKCENILGFPGGGLNRIHQSKGQIVEIDTFSTCNCAIKKEALKQSGGFNEGLKYGGEDELLSNKIRKFAKIFFTPGAKVYHQPRDGWLKIWQWFIRRGKAKWWSLQNQSNSKGTSLIIFLSTSPYLRLLFVFFIALLTKLWLLPCILGIYYLFLLLRYFWIYDYGHSITTHILLPIVRTFMDMAYHTGFIIEATKNILKRTTDGT